MVIQDFSYSFHWQGNAQSNLHEHGVTAQREMLIDCSSVNGATNFKRNIFLVIESAIVPSVRKLTADGTE